MLYLVVDTRDCFYNAPYLVTDNYDEAVERADEEHATVIEINVGHYAAIYEWTEEYDTEEEETQEESYDESEEEYIDENEEYESEEEASQSITYIAEVFEAS